MIALDTNVLVRYLVADENAAQRTAAIRLIDDPARALDPILVTTIVQAETVWVLKRAYGFDKAVIADALLRLADNPHLAIEDEEDFLAALAGWRAAGIDFADLLIAARARRGGATSVATFERRAARHAPFALLPTDP